MRRTRANTLRETTVPLLLLAGDAVVTFAALSLAYWLRYNTRAGGLGIEVPDATFRRYLPLLVVGVGLLLTAFAQFGLYDTRLLLRRYQSLNAIFKGTAFWFATYLCVWLVLRLDPPISRLFVLLAVGCVVALLYIWRTLAYEIITRSSVLGHLRRRTILLGCNDDARALAADLTHSAAHPLLLVGFVPLPTDTRPPFSGSAEAPKALEPILGPLADLEQILHRESADLVIATRADLPRAEFERIVDLCERAYVEWKIVPGAFDIFLSGLRLQTIGHVPVLGVEELAINRLLNRLFKTGLDLVGGLVGLVLSTPFILVLAALIKRESPGGPAFFRQTRVGAEHRTFTLFKLRSMTPDAAAHDATRVSTARNDPRLLKIGAFMRRWNLDELPQFWNVLRGEMSLVGPRPERPYHVDRLSTEIPHYLPRHLVKPGMTGWAQVNGLRGNSDLAARVQHDIYYIENWSVWLDVQILLLTFVRWKNAG